MRKPKKQPKIMPCWELYGGCMVCGAPFLVRPSPNSIDPPEVRQSCLCAPMALAAATAGEHFHTCRDS